jgi:hypothetical protein
LKMSEPAAEDDTRVPVETERERQWLRIEAGIRIATLPPERLRALLAWLKADET